MLGAWVTGCRLLELHSPGKWGCRPLPAVAKRPKPGRNSLARPSQKPGAPMHPAAPARLRVLRLVGIVLALTPAGGTARAQGSAPTVTNMTGSFRPGPYASLSVYPGNSQRIAIGTADGHLVWSEDGGITASEAQVLVPRKFDPVTIRSGARAPFSQRGGEVLDYHVQEQRQRLQFVGLPDERALLSFIYLLGLGLPAGRIQVWMQTSDAIAELGEIAWPKGKGPMLIAAQAGLLISDESRLSWQRTLGGPGYIPREGDIIGLSVAIDPRDGHHMLAATDRGMQVSDNGGYTWAPHPDSDFEDSWVTRIVWDPENPQLVFAVTPDTILLSQDGGQTFEPSFSASGEIKDLSLSAEAAVVATSEGIQVATSEGINTLLPDKDLIGAVPWRDGSFLAATSEALYLVGADGRPREILTTSPGDPYLRLAGDARGAWLLSTHTVLHIGDRVERSRGTLSAAPPRMLLSMDEMERAVLRRTGLGGPEETRLHQRWFSKLLPQVTASVRGTIFYGSDERRDEIVLPFQVWQTQATAMDRTYFEVFANWDLRELAFGDNNVSNPNLIIESQIRDKRNTVIEQIRWHYRECAGLVADLARPPADPELELNWRLRLEEHASYLEWMSGRKVVKRTPIEKLEYTE
jgi:hypothetical protein